MWTKIKDLTYTVTKKYVCVRACMRHDVSFWTWEGQFSVFQYDTKLDTSLRVTRNSKLFISYFLVSPKYNGNNTKILPTPKCVNVYTMLMCVSIIDIVHLLSPIIIIIIYFSYYKRGFRGPRIISRWFIWTPFNNGTI